MRLAVKIATLFGAFVLAILLALRFWILPHLQSSGTAVATIRIARAAIQFQKDHRSFPGESTSQGPRPSPEPKAVATALRGANPSQKNYLQGLPDSLFRDGVLVDSFGRPFRFEIAEGGTLTVISAGPNDNFGDADDISDRTPDESAHRPET